MSEHVVIETSNGILEIRLNRPDKKNALTLDMYAAMSGAMTAANDDQQFGSSY